MLHTAPVGGGYERAAAVAEAQAFLADAAVRHAGAGALVAAASA